MSPSIPSTESPRTVQVVPYPEPGPPYCSRNMFDVQEEAVVSASVVKINSACEPQIASLGMEEKGSMGVIGTPVGEEAAAENAPPIIVGTETFFRDM